MPTSVSVALSILKLKDSHCYFQFYSNTEQFILSFPIYVFVISFFDSEKPGCYYSQCTYLFSPKRWFQNCWLTPLKKRNLLTVVQYLFRPLFAFCLPLWSDIVCKMTWVNLFTPHSLHYRLGNTAWFLLFSYSVILTLCDPMDCSMPGFLVLHQLLELAHTHVYWVGDAIQPSHPLSSPSPPTFNLSQHWGLFPMSWPFTSGGWSVGASPSASVPPKNIQGWFPLRLISLTSMQSSGLSRVFSSTTFVSIVSHFKLLFFSYPSWLSLLILLMVRH